MRTKGLIDRIKILEAGIFFDKNTDTFWGFALCSLLMHYMPDKTSFQQLQFKRTPHFEIYGHAGLESHHKCIYWRNGVNPIMRQAGISNIFI